MVLARGTPLVGEVVVVYDDGVDVVFPAGELPNIALGRRVDVGLARGGTDVQVVSRVIEKSCGRKRNLLSLVFVGASSSSDLGKVLNRRDHSRVVVNPPRQVTVRVAQQSAHRYPAELVDASAGGLGLNIASCHDEALSSADWLLVETRDRSRGLLVTVRNARYRNASLVNYGCEFADKVGDERGIRRVLGIPLTAPQTVESPKVKAREGGVLRLLRLS